MSQLHEATRADLLPEIPGGGLLEVSNRLVITAANERAAELLLHTTDELPGKPLTELVAAEGVHRLAEAFSLANESTLRGTAQAVPFERPNRGRLYLDVEATATETAEGPRVLMALWDVTGYALREKRSESLAANVPGVLFQLFVRRDRRFGFYYLSPRCLDLFGAAPTALMRNPSALPMDPSERSRFEDSLGACFETRSDWSYEGRLLIGALPARWWRAEGKLVTARSTEIVLDGLAYDVTERRETQDQLTRANQAKEKFLSQMSHELRTPLHAIMGSAQMLQRDKRANSRTKVAINSIIESGDHLLSLVNDVLDLATLKGGHVTIDARPFDASRMAERIAAIARASDGRSRANIVISTENINRLLIGDERRLSQIVLNLLANAVKFTDQGTVKLSLSLQRTAERQKLVVTVSDSGPGIKPSEAERIFAAFSQGENAAGRGGTGLGLAISRELAEAMGGTLSLESQAASGTTFRLEIPIEVDPRGIGSRGLPTSEVTQRLGLETADRSETTTDVIEIPATLRSKLRDAARNGDMGDLQELLPKLRELSGEGHALEWLIALIEDFEIERVAQALQGEPYE